MAPEKVRHASVRQSVTYSISAADPEVCIDRVTAPDAVNTRASFLTRIPRKKTGP